MERCRTEFEALTDFYEGRASDDVDAQIRTHLASGCAICQSRLAWLERTLPALPARDLHHAPAPTLVRARALFRERQQQAARRPGFLGRLLHDSRTLAVPAFARGAGSEAFQLLYGTDVHEIELWQEEEANGSWYLIGQMLLTGADDPLSPEIAVLTMDNGQAFTATFVGSEFHFSALGPGSGTLRLTVDRADILMPDVPVGR